MEAYTGCVSCNFNSPAALFGFGPGLGPKTELRLTGQYLRIMPEHAIQAGTVCLGKREG